MKSFAVCLIGLVIFVEAGTAQQSTVSGQVRLSDGLPVAGAQVMLFELADLRRGAVAHATTDESGYFALPLAALGGAFALPQGFELRQNYPNPFNPSTIIPYELAATAQVRLEVFNTLGQRIATLVDREQGAGAYRVRWDGTDASDRAMAAGVYIYRLTVGGVHQAGQMVLVDGQAGVPIGGARLEALSIAEDRGSAYGLVVSGQGLTTHVDSDFGLEVGMRPVYVEVEAQGSARMKRAQSQGILGDVDNNGRVEIADALLVAAYSVNTSTVIPNNGDISLGDVNEDGRSDIVDAWLIAIYSTNRYDPALPSGIGRPTGPDHGDTQDEATRINIGSPTVGYIWPEDTDFFRVRVSDSGRLTAYTTSDFDTYGIIYDSSGDQLASNDDAGSGRNFQFSTRVSPGTYYIQVRGYSSSSEGIYTLHVDMEIVQPDDHGNTRSTATRISLGSETDGRIEPEDDVDFFRVTVSTAGRLSAYTTGSLDTHGYIYDSSGNQLASDDDDGSGRNFQFSTRVSPGIYYIKVEEHGQNNTGNYTLHVDMEIAQPDDHGNTRSTATRISLGSETDGRIDPENDVDFFRVTVSTAGRLSAYTTGSLDTHGYIYDSSGNQLASDDDDGSGRNFRVSEVRVSPGIYYIKVEEHGQNNTGNYTLHVIYIN